MTSDTQEIREKILKEQRKGRTFVGNDSEMREAIDKAISEGMKLGRGKLTGEIDNLIGKYQQLVLLDGYSEKFEQITKGKPTDYHTPSYNHGYFTALEHTTKILKGILKKPESE